MEEVTPFRGTVIKGVYVFNVNGCLFCGALERGHSLRYDHLHPTGRNGYLAPPNEIRKARLKWLRAQRSDK